MNIRTKPPTPTYDLLDLTHDEMRLLAHLLGLAGLKDDRHACVPDLTGRKLFERFHKAGFTAEIK